MAQSPIQTNYMTLDAFLALPESQTQTEFIEGEVFGIPAPIYSHQKAVFSIAKLIDRLGSAGETVISPMDVFIGDEIVLQPDVFWVDNNNEDCFVRDNYWHGSPDLVVEVLSPSTATRDRGIKFDLYEKYAVQEYWLVDPAAQNIECYHLENNKFSRAGVFGLEDSFKSDTLKGQSIEVKAIFP